MIPAELDIPGIHALGFTDFRKKSVPYPLQGFVVEVENGLREAFLVYVCAHDVLRDEFNQGFAVEPGYTAVLAQGIVTGFPAEFLQDAFAQVKMLIVATVLVVDLGHYQDRLRRPRDAQCEVQSYELSLGPVFKAVGHYNLCPITRHLESVASHELSHIESLLKRAD